MTYAQIQSLIYELTKRNSSDLPVATLNLYTQPAEDRVAALILAHDSKWQWDDLNRTTDLPIDTQDLVSGQQDYALGASYLSLDRVEIKDTNGNWHRLKQIDQQELKRDLSQSLTDYQKTNGMPTEYDIVGNSVFLYPAPNFSQASSLKFYYTRGPLKFDYTLGTFTDATGSTSSTPGFAPTYHHIIAYYAAYDWLNANSAQNITGMFNTIQRIEADLITYYGMKNRDFRGRLSVSTDSNK